jgi:2-C-methyl-D-erythritol 4-phosphate cytidylyltransferase
VSAEQAYTAVVDARLGRAPGVDGLLLKEKLGGKSVLSHSLDRFDDDGRCSGIVVLAAEAVKEWIAGDPLTFASGKLRLVDDALGLAAAVAAAQEPVTVLQEGWRPNWQPALLDSLLRQWQPGRGVLPVEALAGPLVQGAAGGAAPAAEAASVQDFFGGGAPQPASPLQHVAEFIPTRHLGLLETPQVYATRELRGALAAHPAAPGAPEACHAAGVPLLLVPARAHNIAIRDGDGLHLLRRLLGEPKKGGKDRYGGLGW